MPTTQLWKQTKILYGTSAEETQEKSNDGTRTEHEEEQDHVNWWHWKIQAQWRRNWEYELLGALVTVGSAITQEILCHLVVGKTTMKYLDKIFKSKDIRLLTKMRLDPHILLCLRKLDDPETRPKEDRLIWNMVLEKNPAWTTRRTNKSIKEEIKPEIQLKAQIMKLHLFYFGHTVWRERSVKMILWLGRLRVKGSEEDNEIQLQWQQDGHWRISSD